MKPMRGSTLCLSNNVCRVIKLKLSLFLCSLRLLAVNREFVGGCGSAPPARSSALLDQTSSCQSPQFNCCTLFSFSSSGKQLDQEPPLT